MKITAPNHLIRRTAASAAGLLLALSTGCCCLPCGPCGTYGGCVPADLPAPNSFAGDFSGGCAPGCGIPSYAVPGCGMPTDIMPGCAASPMVGCEMPIIDDCGPAICETACDGCGVGAGVCGSCQPFPLLSGAVRGIGKALLMCIPRCGPCVCAVNPYQPGYYCDSGFGGDVYTQAGYEQPVYQPVEPSMPTYHAPVTAPTEYHDPVTVPTPQPVPQAVPAQEQTSYGRGQQWRPSPQPRRLAAPSGVRQVQYQQVAPPRPQPNFIPPAPSPTREVHKPGARQAQHPSWQPPRW